MFQLIITITLIQIIKLTIGDFSLVVLHTNDMHARYEECNRKGEPCTEDDIKGNNCYGGFPRVSYIVNEIKREAKIKGQNVIFVNAGDTYLGSNYHSAFIWEVASDMMNQLNYDIMCLGNHEFDDGVENLIPFLQKVNFPVVCCNINTSEEKTLQNEENLYSSYIININGTTDIGVIGYITQKTVTISRPGKVQLLDEISCIKNEVQKLKDKGVNIIMGLGHSGIEKDVEIIQNIPDIDFIVGGHSHTFLHTGDPPLEFAERLSGDYPKLIKRENVSSASDVPVAHAYAFTRYIGKLELLFDDDGNLKDFSGNTLLLDTSVEEDSHVKFVLNKWKDKLKEKEIEYVGNTEVVLEGGNIPCRVEECNMGNLITDAFIDYNMKNGFKDTGIAVYPAGGIRFGINVTAVGGNISTGDLMRVLPFRDRLYQIDIDGQYLKEALEHSVYNLGEKYRRGEFLQYAGIKVVYNVSQPSGERVYSALVKSTYEGEYEELNINSTYTVLLPDCLSHGSDGYTMLQKYIAPPIEIANSVYEVVKNYIKENSPITTENSGRIKFVNSSIES